MITSRKTLSSLGLLLLVAGQLLPQVDFSIVNVGLDVIGRTLHTDETGLVLIVALYGLSFATLIATGARLGDRFGRRRVFMCGVAGFCVASAICGLATSVWPMLLGRLLQGVCGAILAPQILATIHATLSGEAHGRAVGIYTSINGLSVAIGQILGGWLVTANLFGLGWRVAFFINVPVCLAILCLGARLIPETRADSEPRMDAQGMTLFALFLLCLLLPIALGERWHTLWWLLLGLLPTGWGLWQVESRKEAAGQQPLLPPALFRTPLVVLGFTGAATVNFGYTGYLFVTALSLQSVLHFTPLQSGNAFIPLGVMFFAGSLLIKRINRVLSLPVCYMVGACCTLAGFLLSVLMYWHYGTRLSSLDLIWATGIMGLGNSMMLTCALRIALTHVGRQYAGEASSVLNTVQQGCFAVGTAVVGAIYATLLAHGYLVAVSVPIGLLCLLLIGVAITVFTRVRGLDLGVH